ncbi:hypothetical protein CHELA1G11_11192 [Hyphomicrobiales bacterium]|nr:hypothetical protein CHELA1G11_11192 [Hyphomicrobiales bacterium]
MSRSVTVEVGVEVYLGLLDDDDLINEISDRGLLDRLPYKASDLAEDGLREIRRGHLDHGVCLIEAALYPREISPETERKKYDAAMAAKREATHVQLAA